MTVEWEYRDLAKWIESGCNDKISKKIKKLSIETNSIDF